MSNIVENAIWSAFVRLFDANAVLTGGADSAENLPISDLANRTLWLKQFIEAVQTALVGHQSALDPHSQYMTAAESDTAIANAVAALVASSPAVLDTLNELAVALGNDPNFATTINTALAARIKTFATGVALPTTNIGPIWHDDYNSLMTWQVFNANGAAYTGYASVLVGNLLMDTQPTPRAGYFKSGTANLNRTTYAAMRGWAMHNGIMVATGTWAAGTIAVADNADGTTFKAFDVRGEFPRFWDDGRGIDPARAFGSWQKPTLVVGDCDGDIVSSFNAAGLGTSIPGMQHVGADPVNMSDYPYAQMFYAPLFSKLIPTSGLGYYGGTVRTRNVSLLASIKF